MHKMRLLGESLVVIMLDVCMAQHHSIALAVAAVHIVVMVALGNILLAISN